MTVLEICWILFSVLKEFTCIQIELRETTVEAGKEDMLIPVDGQVWHLLSLNLCAIDQRQECRHVKLQNCYHLKSWNWHS